MLLALFGCASGGPTRESSRAMDQLARDYWEFTLRESPTWATYLGDHRYNDRLADIGPEGRRRRLDAHTGFLKRLHEIDPKTLGEVEQVTWDILRIRLELAIEEEKHGFWQWAVDQMDGPQADFPQLLNYHPQKTAKDLQDLEARFRAFPRYMDQYLANLAEGVKSGRVAPKLAVERVLGQLDKLLATDPGKSPFAVAGSHEILAAIRDCLYPAYAKMRDFLRTYPARDEVGLSALPSGPEAYRYRIRLHTTTDLTAEQIHQIGLDELASLEARMREIAKGDLREFISKLKRDPANFYPTREELHRDAERLFRKAQSGLPALFGRLPKIECVVKPIEEYREKDSVAAFYYSAPEDGSRPAVYYINTFDPTSRPRYNLPALTVHEAVPGHHLQIAIAMELGDLPQFRRHGHFTAYVEGWGLYSETLGEDLGLYDDPLSRFGMLTYQAWRACRLVVDTGLHAMGWTRERAIRFFRDHLALSETEIVNEIDRYIIWPGQALAYMIGRREIQALRDEAKAKLGARFDLRAFHDEILRHGAVPLSTLRKLIEAWIRAR